MNILAIEANFSLMKINCIDNAYLAHIGARIYEPQAYAKIIASLDHDRWIEGMNCEI